MYRWVARIQKTGGVISRISPTSFSCATDALKDYEDNARGKFLSDGWKIVSVSVSEIP